MRRAFKFRLEPTAAQEAQLWESLELCRTVYNAALEERQEAYRRWVKLGRP